MRTTTNPLKLAAGTLILLLSGCHDAGNNGPTDAGNAATLCVNSDCGSKLELVTIPDAENIFFLDDGRLIVSGGRNVYEITGSLDAGFVATPLSAEDCGFTGLAVAHDHLYAVCGDSKLYATPLGPQLALQAIYEFADTCIPNGTVAGPDGHLYVVDEPLNPACGTELPKIMRLRINPAAPMQVQAQENWIEGSSLGGLAFGTDTVLRFPNGLARIGQRFYGTDGGSVFYADLLADGSAGPVTPIFFQPTAHDDLSVAGDTLLVTDFFGGSIFQLGLDGELLQTTNPATFDSPSAVMRGRPPMFSPSDLLVTEKGVLQDPDGPVGNVLSLFRAVPDAP